MAKQVYRLVHGQARHRATEGVRNAKDGSIVTISDPTRSLEQNARMWAMLSDVSRSVDWHGYKLTAEEWKAVFTAALTNQKVVPGLSGGFVVLGKSTSSMNVAEMSELVELMMAFGSENGVHWSDA